MSDKREPLWMTCRGCTRRSALSGLSAIATTTALPLTACSGVEQDDSADAEREEEEELCHSLTTVCIDLTDPKSIEDFGAVGDAGYALAGGALLLIIHIDEDAYLALSPVCTHTGCFVVFEGLAEDIVCPCHGSRFSLGGAVLEGPATRPLALYSTRVDGDTLVVDLE